MTFSLLIALFLLLGGYFSIHCAEVSVTDDEKEIEFNPVKFLESFVEITPPLDLLPQAHTDNSEQAHTESSSNQTAEDFSEDIADPVDQSKEAADDRNKDNDKDANQDKKGNEQEENSETTVFHPQEKNVPSTPISSAAAKQPSNPLNVPEDANSRHKKRRTTLPAPSFYKLSLGQPMNNSDADTKNEVGPILNPYANNNSTVSAPPNPSSVAEGDQLFEKESNSEMDPESKFDDDSEFECDEDSDSEFQPKRTRRSRRISTSKKQKKKSTDPQEKKKTQGRKRKRVADATVQDKKAKKARTKKNSPAELTGDSAYNPGKVARKTSKIRSYTTRSHVKETTSDIQNSNMPQENDNHNLLKGKNSLNEAVINEYLQLIASLADDVYVFNTSFFPAYTSNGYEHVRSWNGFADIFSKRLLLFPIRITLGKDRVHWSLAVAEVPTKRLLYFDSVYDDGQEYLAELENYLNSEHKARKGAEKWFELRHFPSAIPKQEKNKNYDCGVFVLQYAKEIVQYRLARINDVLETLKFEFEEKNIPKIRKKMFEELQSKEIQFKVQPARAARAPFLTTTNTVVDPTSQNVLRLSSGRASQGASLNATSQNVPRLSAGRAFQAASPNATSTSGTTGNQEQVTNSVNRFSNVKVRSPDHIIQQPAPVFVQGPRSNTSRNNADFSNQQPHTVTDANPSNKRRHDLVMEESADENSNIDTTKQKEVNGTPCKRLRKGE